ncbi:fused MFS/spermidine synthase [candidate division KSB1 bacterium]|nr:fused MFS/spermidine synthase [candidate division KSB1 bacterium]
MFHYLIYLLFFLSGAAGLMYQLIWVRKLALIFGNTTYATSSVLTAFMGGLALGSYLIGKYADRIKSPLKFYGWLELGIGLAAILILFFLLPVSDAIYVWLFGILGNNAVIFNAVRFLLSILILIIPTTLMGGTLPVISKYFIKTSENFGQRLGRLYGFNTLGAVVGAFLTGYFLIRIFGVSATLWIAIGLNLALGVAAWLLGNQSDKMQAAPARPEKKPPPKKPHSQTLPSKIRSYDPRVAKLVLWLFGVAGFVSLAYEVVWTRALIFFISSTTYSFTIILTTFLIGIALGSLVVAKWVDRMTRLLLWLCIFELIIALAAMATIFLLMHLNTFQKMLIDLVQPGGWTQVSALLFVTAFLILIIPTIGMGAAFPIVNRIFVENVATIGKGVGHVYMANTVGAIFGSFMSGFMLIPWLGLNTSILFLASLNLAIAITLLFFEKDFATHKRRALVYAGAAVLLFLLISVPTFTTTPIFLKTAGFFDTRLLHHKDTAAATVSVLEKKDQINIWGRNVRYLNVNGHNTAHTTYADMIIHKMLAHLPMLLTPNPKHALVVGFGFGNTCRSLLDYAMLKTVDCVELVDYEKRTADFFKTENEGVFRDPRFRFIVNDGRNYILAARKQYDIISINSVDPKFSPTLYTEEFYRLCRARLNENGQLVAWLPIYGMSLAEVQSLVQSFIRVFPNASLWYNNPEHLLLAGIKGAYPFDLAFVKSRMESPPVAASLAAIHLNDPYTFLATFFCGGPMLHKFAGSVPSHTDNHPQVEFSRISTKEMMPDVYQELLQCRESILLYCTNFEVFGAIEPIRNMIYQYEAEMKNLIAAFFTYRMFGTDPEQKENVAEALKAIRKILDDEPANDFALMQYVDLVSHQDLSADRKYFEAAVAKSPDFAKAEILLGLELASRNEWEKARALFQRALQINDQYLTAWLNAGYAEIQLQRWEQAKQSFEKLFSLDPENPFAYSTLAQVYYMLQDFPSAISYMLTAIRNQPEQANLYFNLGRMYQKNNQLKEAIATLEKGLKISPYDQRARQLLEELKKKN